LSIDEYACFNVAPGGGGPFGGMTLRQDLAYGMILNEMLRYTDFMTMAARTAGVALADFNRTSATLPGRLR
jgi:alpha-N-arabinofuranosidase